LKSIGSSKLNKEIVDYLDCVIEEYDDLLMTDYAAKNGNLELLKYVHENGCPWAKILVVLRH
jgi:hypothetical protein